MAHHIVMFDMHEVGSLFESRNFIIQVFHPGIEFWIATVNKVQRGYTCAGSFQYCI